VTRVASFNVENLFERPKAFDPRDWSIGKPALEAYEAFNKLIAKPVYTSADRRKMRDLLLKLDIYTRNSHNAIRRKQSVSPRWAWLRKNKGAFDSEPADATENVEIIARGRDDWNGWVELATEPTDELSTQMTARVIADVDADIIGIIEAEDRPALVHFNEDLLAKRYRQVMLVDGNDERGIDVGIMTKAQHTIESIRSNVDTEDASGPVFSRDCPQYEIRTPSGTTLHILVNHFKSQSGGGGAKRARQAAEVRRIAQRLVDAGASVVVLGDLNEGMASETVEHANIGTLFATGSPVVACYTLPGFDLGGRLGTFDSCGIRNRLDYVLISRDLVPAFRGGAVYRCGLWGQRETRPTAWLTYPEITRAHEQASDHGLVYVDLDV
jgi:endonuclease/exonuclease/phosphatase family metal-dependent hydrolase